MGEGGGGGGGSGGGTGGGIILNEIVKLFTGSTRRSDADKAVRNFQRALFQNPDLSPMEAVAVQGDRTKLQFFNFATRISREAGVSLDQFLLQFIPQTTFNLTAEGSRASKPQRLALAIPNINRLAGIELGLLQPLPPRRTERPGLPAVGPLDMARLLAILVENLFGNQGGLFGRSGSDLSRPAPRQTRQTLPRQPFPRIQLPGGRQVPLLDSFGTFLGQVTQAAATILPQFGIGQQQQPIFNFAQPGFPVQQASANLEGVFNIPALGPGTAIQGQAASLGCITPVTTQSTRLPRTVDVPVQDAAGNVKISTYVRAPRVRYKVSIRPARRSCRGR